MLPVLWGSYGASRPSFRGIITLLPGLSPLGTIFGSALTPDYPSRTALGPVARVQVPECTSGHGGIGNVRRHRLPLASPARHRFRGHGALWRFKAMRGSPRPPLIPASPPLRNAGCESWPF
jgi:hypothetical protein